ncbi:MAG: hypothetical protein IJH68_13710 [Thermoguttaceae bacterium]|nr:hypothetical protein [Thermoguttaceae bacterium]
MNRVLSTIVFLLLASPALWAEETSLLERCLEDGMPDEIVFALRKPSTDPHWYGNLGYYAIDDRQAPFPKHSGGRICIYNVKTKQCRTLFDAPQGNIRDICVHYDAEKILFSYLPPDGEHYSLWELNLDGTNLTRLTGIEKEKRPYGTREDLPERLDGWDDIEGCYLPDGGIVFCSSRVNRYVQCWLTQVATIHRCDGDGQNARLLSCNVEQDNNPWILPNGRIAYMRWEYVDRYHMAFHHLWTMNPDGTRQMVFYGNQQKDGVFLDPKPVPDSERIVATYSPGHGIKEHYGRIALFDDSNGPDDPAGVQFITKTNEYSDPWAFSQESFLAASKRRLVLLDDQGNEELLYQVPDDLPGFWIGEPRPIVRHEREPVIADGADLSRDTGTFAMVNIYRGRQMKDLPPGTVKELLLYEVMPKPINYTGAMSEISSGGTFSVERFLGSVPVTEEGSAYFRVPANTSILFAALDAQGHCVKRMHSFTSVVPGEIQTCIGCHEDRREAPDVEDGRKLRQITQGDPDIPDRHGVPEIIDFNRDIQPILDRHCVECHNTRRREGGLNLSGHWGPNYSLGYQQMSWRALFGDNRVILPYESHNKSDFKPYEIGTGSSRLLKLIEEGHEGAALSEEETRLVRFWLDEGAAYSGTYAVNSTGTIGTYVFANVVRDDKDWPELADYEDVLTRRCDRCHAPDEESKKIGTFLPAQFYASYYPPQKNMFIARSMTQDNGRFNRHEIFDLSYPDESLVLLGPLAQEAGGLGTCQSKSGEAVFTDTADPDYQKILTYIARGRRYILEENNRYVMSFQSPNNGPDCPKRFVPRKDYIREMKRYGVLPPDFDPSTPVDPFELEERYFDIAVRHREPGEGK